MRIQFIGGPKDGFEMDHNSPPEIWIGAIEQPLSIEPTETNAKVEYRLGWRTIDSNLRRKVYLYVDYNWNHLCGF